MLRRFLSKSIKTINITQRQSLKMKFSLRNPIKFRFSEKSEEIMEEAPKEDLTNNGKHQPLLK